MKSLLIKKYGIITSCILFSTLNVFAQEMDTLSVELHSVNIKGKRVRSYIKTATVGGHIINLGLMGNMPQILGNADPIHYSQMLPSVQTNNEFDSGLHIYGSESGHNRIGIHGVPLYNVAHLMGIFSVFNTSHFTSLRLQKIQTGSESLNILGGVLDMRDNERDSILKGEITVGPISSQGTIAIPVNEKSSLRFSARTAYMNLLYSRWLRFDDEQIHYSFSDFNLTFTHSLSQKDRLWIDLYSGGDKGRYDTENYFMETSIDWGNHMAALHWHRKGKTTDFTQTFYVTHYYNHLNLYQDKLTGKLPSHITDVGSKSSLSWENTKIGCDIVWHNIRLQKPSITGMITQASTTKATQKALETALYMDHNIMLSERTAVMLGARTTYFINESHATWVADPTINIKHTPSNNSEIVVNASTCHQFLHKTGFTNLGMPTEFWMASCETYKPQKSYNLSAAFGIYLKNHEYKLSSEIYIKRLSNLIEYNGSIFNFIYEDYDLDKYLTQGIGINYGINLMLEKRKGDITGWLALSLGRARRKYNQDGKAFWYPSMHERPIELNAVALWNPAKHLRFGATFVMASGNPFTPIRRMYLLNNNIVSAYGAYNSERTDTYMRLDLSATYDFSTDNHGHSINLSLYNTLMRDNAVFRRLGIDDDTGECYYSSSGLIQFILPSISYQYKF